MSILQGRLPAKPVQTVPRRIWPLWNQFNHLQYV